MASSVQNAGVLSHSSERTPVRVQIHPQQNSNARRGLAGSMLDFLGTAEGIFRFGQMMERIPKFTNAVRESCGARRIAVLDTLSAKGLGAWTWGTTFPRIAEVLVSAKQANTEAAQALTDGSSEEHVKYKAMKASLETSEAVSMSCHGLAMVTGLFPQANSFSKMFSSTADSMGLAHDGIALGMVCQNLTRAYGADLEGATPEVLEAVRQTKTDNWLEVAKGICSIVSGVLGVVFAATGSALIGSGLFLAALSLSSPALSIIRKMHVKTMDYVPVNFLDRRHVSVIV